MASGPFLIGSTRRKRRIFGAQESKPDGPWFGFRLASGFRLKTRLKLSEGFEQLALEEAKESILRGMADGTIWDRGLGPNGVVKRMRAVTTFDALVRTFR